MKAIFIVLTEVEKLNPLLSKILDAGFHGGTILDSTGTAQALFDDSEDFSSFRVLRSLINFEKKNSKTVFFICSKDEEEQIIAIAKGVIGDFDQPNQGIIFSFPIDKFIK